MTRSKVSEITTDDLAEYIHLDELTSEETDLLNSLLIVAKAYIRKYTGHTDEELDESADFVIVTYILVQDMWDNRTMYVDSANLNRVVESILDLHSVNLL